MTRFIEDSWVRSRSGRVHQVYSVNFAVLMQCGKWLAAESLTLATTGPYPPASWRLCKTCERSYRRSVPA